jgi:hypothetical protein
MGIIEDLDARDRQRRISGKKEKAIVKNGATTSRLPRGTSHVQASISGRVKKQGDLEKVKIDIDNQVSELKELLDGGIINKEEFAEQKKEIVGRAIRVHKAAKDGTDTSYRAAKVWGIIGSIWSFCSGIMAAGMASSGALELLGINAEPSGYVMVVFLSFLGLFFSLLYSKPNHLIMGILVLTIAILTATLSQGFLGIIIGSVMMFISAMCSGGSHKRVA